MRALQQEHLSQEVEDDSMKGIPDNIDFNQDNRKEISDYIDSNQGHVGGKDETDRQSNATPQEILQANAAHAQSSEDSRPISPLDEANGHAASQSEDSRPLSPLKPAIPAKPNLAILAARRLSQASQQASVQPENEETTFLSDSQNVVLSSDAQKQKEPLDQNEDERDAILIAQSSPLTSMEALTDK